MTQNEKPHVPGYLDHDQGMGVPARCVKWECHGAPIIGGGRYWTCARCGSSYGSTPEQ